MRSRHFLSLRSRRFAATAVAVLAAALLPALTPPASALPGSIFELDANTADSDVATSPDDWNTLYLDPDYAANGPYGHATAYTKVLADLAGDSIFIGGGSKDDLDVPGSWAHTDGSVPDKDEITNAYAAAYLAPDSNDADELQDLILYFGADRYAQNGSANVGFWFTKEAIAPVEGGTFSGQHQKGDTLVLSEFTNGGAVSTIQVWEWDTTGSYPGCPSNVTSANVGCRDNGVLVLRLAQANADCDVVSPTADACANVNPAETTVPWPYDAKGGGNQPGKVPAGGFIEGGVNVSRLLGGQPCLSNFLAETRSSPALDAVLKDFVQGAFPLCGAAVQIAGNGVNEVGEDHTFTVTAQQKFGGATAPAQNAHVDVTLTDANGAVNDIDEAASTCDDAGDNVDANGQCVIVFTSESTGTVTGSATATVTIGGQQFVATTNGVSPNSGTVLKRFVDAKITLSPLTDTNGITENHVVTADVDVDLGDGAGFVAATVGHVDVTVVPSGGAGVTINSSTDPCHRIIPPATPDAGGADNLNALGRCTIAFTSSTAGTVTVHGTVNLTVSGIPVTRQTDGQGDNSADATKDFVDGSLVWYKIDGGSDGLGTNGLPLGGATFEVCRTHAWNSNAGTFDDITDTCVTVLDDSAPDADPTPGTFSLVDLPLGRYTIRETIAPAGYQLDPDTVTVNLSTTGTLNGNGGTFVDPKLFRLIVITCNTTDESLVDSTVTLNGAPGDDTRETIKPGQLPSGITESALCQLPGANYDNLPAGSYSPQVELPDENPKFP